MTPTHSNRFPQFMVPSVYGSPGLEFPQFLYLYSPSPTYSLSRSLSLSLSLPPSPSLPPPSLPPSLPLSLPPSLSHQVMGHSKRLVSCVVAVFNETKLALAVNLECLCEVEGGILSYLCDDRLLKLEEVAQLNRAFNYLMYRMCENCEKTRLFG